MASRIISEPLTRREFNAASVSALFVGMTVWMSGCGGGGESSSAYPTAPTSTPAPTAAPSSGSDKAAAIAGNHGHAATVTGAVLQAGGAVTLSMRGTADHDHSVQLTQDEVRRIAGGTRVTSMSSDGGGMSDGYGGTTGSHTHAVTFN